MNVLFGSDKRKIASYLSEINMDCTEAIVNNNSVKIVRKLQVLRSFRQCKLAMKIQQSSREINKVFSTCRRLK